MLYKFLHGLALIGLAFVLPVQASSQGESLPGGETTTNFKASRGFISPSSNLSRAEQLKFWVGLTLFEDPWITAPATTTDRDGLGPLFNAHACSACHLSGAKGIRPEEGVLPVSLLLKMQSINGAKPKAMAQLGSQLQTRAINAFYEGHQALQPEGNISVRYTERVVTLDDGHKVSLRKPHYTLLTALDERDFDQVNLSLRAAPNLMGGGLIDAIASQDILDQINRNAETHEVIRGKAGSGEAGFGRFGWKAQHSSLAHQVAAALNQDMGISSVLMPEDMCTPTQTHCAKAPHGRDSEFNVEIVPKLFDALLFQTSHIAPTKPISASDDSRKGRLQFYSAGCNAGHRPSFTTRKDYPDHALAGQTIWPYSDFLLHDMGEELADIDVFNKPSKHPVAKFWRTPPLWGIGRTEQLNAKPYYLHDGRARTIEEAALWHGGEAKQARENYTKLSALQRKQLLAFIKTL